MFERKDYELNDESIKIFLEASKGFEEYFR